jgi:hypothetical protein
MTPLESVVVNCRRGIHLELSMADKSQVRFAFNQRRSTDIYREPSGVYPIVKVSDFGNPNQVLESFSRSWVRTPNYQALARSGNLPDNPYSYTEYRCSRTSGTYDTGEIVTGPGYSVQTILQYFPSVTAGAHPFSERIPYSSLNGKLLERMRGNSWNTPVFAAEAGKTADMVIKRSLHLVHLIRSLRKGDFHSFKNGLHPDAKLSNGVERRFKSRYGTDPSGAAGNAWLEAKYGWAPFMNDCRDAVNAVMDAIESPLGVSSHVKAKLSSESTRRTTGIVFSDTGKGFSVYGTVVVKEEESVKALWRFRPTSLDLPARFGLTNPLTVAWELLPFSFVVDWFLPIGGYLSQLDTPLRVTHLGGTYGRKRKVHEQTFPFLSQGMSGFNGQGTWVAVERVPMTSIPEIRLSDLTMELKLSASRVTTSLALLQQQLSRLKR